MSRLRQKNAQATIDLTSDCEEQSADTQVSHLYYRISFFYGSLVEKPTHTSSLYQRMQTVSLISQPLYRRPKPMSTTVTVRIRAIRICHREAMLEVLHSHASTVVNRTSGRLAIAESKTRAASVLKMEESAWPKTHTSTTGRRENLRLQKLERYLISHRS